MCMSTKVIKGIRNKKENKNNKFRIPITLISEEEKVSSFKNWLVYLQVHIYNI